MYCIEFPNQERLRVNMGGRAAGPNTALVEWARCETIRVHFESNNAWQSCPDGSLLTGFYRGTSNGLDGISYFRCCRPARPM